jgi:hypothetical protein
MIFKKISEMSKEELTALLDEICREVDTNKTGIHVAYFEVDSMELEALKVIANKDGEDWKAMMRSELKERQEIWVETNVDEYRSFLEDHNTNDLEQIAGPEWVKEMKDKHDIQ